MGMPRERLLRDVWIAATIVGPLILLGLFLVVRGNGFDTYSYWRVPHGGTDLYVGTSDPGGPPGTFRYAPAFAQLVSLLWWLPWGHFLAAWTLLNLTAFLLIAPRRWWLAGLAFTPVPFEIFDGNIHLLMALALVAAAKWPAAWSFLLLTKVTPGLGLIWYVVRHEWRNLAIAIGATAGIVVVSAAIGGTGVWLDWVRSLAQERPADWTVFGSCPFPLRLAMALGLVVWGARRGAMWVLPVAAVLSLASPWLHSLSILVACVPLAARSGAHVALPYRRWTLVRYKPDWRLGEPA
jgi:hypothetical protein